MTQLAERTKLIKPSVTLAIAAKAGKLRAEGVDVVNFSAGEPDFDTPEHIKAAAVEALRQGMTKYTDVKGIEPLRAAIPGALLGELFGHGAIGRRNTEADSLGRIQRFSHQAGATRGRADAARTGLSLEQSLQSDRRNLQSGRVGRAHECS